MIWGLLNNKYVMVVEHDWPCWTACLSSSTQTRGQWQHSLSGPSAQVIRGLLDNNKYVVVVEHDLAVLDYLSDFICCLYGKPGAYGVVTMPFSVREVPPLPCYAPLRCAALRV